MRVELKPSNNEDAHIIKNLYPLYLHDISEFDGNTPNRHGLIGEDDSVTTLARQGEAQDNWWQNPEALFPYLILVGGCPAGFNLIATNPCLPQGIEADFEVHEFFLVHAYRGKGVAEQAAIEGFDRHRGKWEVVTCPAHERAIAFWRKVLSNYMSGRYSENEGDHPWGRKLIFNFDNSL
ncbi:GNAT family N-acetyltransferase [Candidatus Hydrogenedentota bacterium]